MTFLTKFAPLIVLAVNAAAAALFPGVAAFWAAHTTLATLLAPFAVFFPQPHK